ncbi:MAG: hypothetical protein PSY14_00035 [bacterium]|nr:hypothetical protein [bacterium]
MSGQSNEEIQKQADEVVKQIREFVPPEMLGFLIAGLMVLGFIGIIWFFHRMRTPVSHVKTKMSFKRNRSRAREGAIAAGFVVEDIERETPEFHKGTAYVLARETCAHYHWPENVKSKAEWELLCRPEEYAPGLGQRGWVIQTNQGRMSPEILSTLNSITRSLGPPLQFFEIEMRDSQIHFYWQEHGGDEAVDMLTTFTEMLKRAP